MKKLLLMIATVGILFTACDKDSEHDFIEYDYSEALIGTWTYVADNGQAEAMVINPDGSFEVTGIMKGGSLYEEKGTIEVVNNKVSLVFDGDTDAIEGRLELVAGKSLSIVINDEYDIRLTYDYCENDFSEEIIGMWVCTNSFANTENDMLIQTFKEDGTSIMTGYISDMEDFVTNAGGSTYKVIGDLFINILPADAVAGGVPPCMAMKLDYTPNGLAYGDIMTFTHYLLDGIKSTDTFLRIKQSLDLANKNYDYSNIYVTNVKGEDKAFEFAGQTLNFATLDGKIMDKLMRHILFNVSFDAEKIYYNCYFNGENKSIDAPIVVDGNKVTIKMSENSSVYRDIEVYMFQDQGNTQMHMYMPATSFEKFFGNVSAAALAKEGKLDLSDAEAVAQIYASIEEAIETINVSFIFKDSTRAL